MKEEKHNTKEKPKKKISKKEKKEIAKKQESPKHEIIQVKKIKIPKRQKALEEKKTKLAVKAQQTKWAPFWVVLRKFGTGSAKFHHVSEMTRYKRSWRRTKLHIKPRKIRKWHMG